MDDKSYSILKCEVFSDNKKAAYCNKNFEVTMSKFLFIYSFLTIKIITNYVRA